MCVYVYVRNCHAFYYYDYSCLSDWCTVYGIFGRMMGVGRPASLLHLSQWNYRWCDHKSSPIKLCFGSSDKSELLNWRLMKREWLKRFHLHVERVCVAIKWSHLLIYQHKMMPAHVNWLVNDEKNKREENEEEKSIETPSSSRRSQYPFTPNAYFVNWQRFFFLSRSK